MSSRFFRFLLIAACALAAPSWAHAKKTRQLMLQSTTFAFASAAETGKLLVANDPFKQQLSDLDRQIAAHQSGPVSKKELDFSLANSGRSFTPEEITRLAKAVEALGIIMRKKHYKLALPRKVVFAKNDPLMYDGTAYTRANAIFWTTKMLSLPDRYLVTVLAHELVHVATRANPSLREHVFPLVGFNRCAVPLQALSPEIDSIRITNPDTEDFGRYCITLADGSVQKRYTTILIKRGNYHGDNFGFVVHPVLIELLPDGRTPVLENGKTKLREMDVPYIVAIGGNALGEPWHPEEIVANNFHTAIFGPGLLGNPNLEFAERVAQRLSAASARLVRKSN